MTTASSSSGNATSGSGGSTMQSGSGGMGGAGGSSNGASGTGGNSSGMGGEAGMGGAGGGNNSGGSGGAGGMPTSEFCDNSLDSLLACFRFENPIADESGKLNTVTMFGLSQKTGKDGLAGNFQPGASSYLRIDDAPHWDVQDFTVEAWIYVRNYPVSPERMGIFDSDGRYGFFVLPTDVVNCSRGPSNVKWTGLQLNTWTHVTCALGSGNLSLYINGSKVAEAGGATAPDPGAGMNAIGGNAPSGNTMDGMIDNFRVWNVRRTDEQICKAAGSSGC